ncbi:MULTISPECIES: GNAT family N-acetyltransferase [unclassified Halomonas]|uniref:GNAT family N-acetyltransferase n=1 Tax=unclassified Halomonas TaxID=2609666 RepID=UPI001C976E5A|nr:MULTISPECIES: GNAT family N-acetyltransferase [unclassified Halomonas]MBY5926324.1 GNAT family N-acetyltransferase [Halomonas sp. DP4Y7-2]MBY6233366.1 GNAT family N-acetyltransferase [Halomonas sp. DP4Y7-1]
MFQFKQDDLTHPDMVAMIRAHRRDLKRLAPDSPPESRHALSLDELKGNDVTLWGLWEQDRLVGCVALKAIGHDHGEIKSMRTAADQLRRGIATRMLEHLIAAARQRGYRRLSLETGSQPGFAPARRFYAQHGFVICAPFADYVVDPNSVYMTLELAPHHPGIPGHAVRDKATP